MCVIQAQNASDFRVLGHILLVVTGFCLNPVHPRPKSCQDIELEIITVRQNDLGINQVVEIKLAADLCRNLSVDGLDLLENESFKPLPPEEPLSLWVAGCLCFDQVDGRPEVLVLFQERNFMKARTKLADGTDILL